jgi:hypothetical protein
MGHARLGSAGRNEPILKHIVYVNRVAASPGQFLVRGISRGTEEFFKT